MGIAKTSADPATLIRAGPDAVCTQTSTDTEFLAVYCPLSSACPALFAAACYAG
jgi:hypothetical protein